MNITCKNHNLLLLTHKLLLLIFYNNPKADGKTLLCFCQINLGDGDYKNTSSLQHYIAFGAACDKEMNLFSVNYAKLMSTARVCRVLCVSDE